jgi:hypothetical protein
MIDEADLVSASLFVCPEHFQPSTNKNTQNEEKWDMKSKIASNLPQSSPLLLTLTRGRTLFPAGLCVTRHCCMPDNGRSSVMCWLATINSSNR